MAAVKTDTDVPRRLGPELYNGIEKDSLAFKLMSSMGWKEGEGLGASKQGITQYLKVKKKFDLLGMGAAEQLDRSQQWTTGMWTYDKVLSGLKEITAKHDAPQETTSSGSETSDSSSSSSSSTSGNSSGSGNESDSDSDGPIPVVEASNSQKRAISHVGRYQKRERAKLVKGYSTQDLAAILGSNPCASARNGTAVDSAMNKAVTAATSNGGANAQPAVQTHPSSSSSSLSSESAGTDDEASEKCENAIVTSCGGCASQLMVNGGALGSVSAVVGRVAPPSERLDVWWTKYFVRATAVLRGGRESRKLDRRVVTDPQFKSPGFLEQDQENLYHKVHDGATHGKQGLGRGTMPPKVAGQRWCGTKTRLDSSSSSDDDDDAKSDVTRDSNDEVGLSDDDDCAAVPTTTNGVTITAPKKPSATVAPAVVSTTRLASPNAAVTANYEGTCVTTLKTGDKPKRKRPRDVKAAANSQTPAVVTREPQPQPQPQPLSTCEVPKHSAATAAKQIQIQDGQRKRTLKRKTFTKSPLKEKGKSSASQPMGDDERKQHNTVEPSVTTASVGAVVSQSIGQPLVAVSEARTAKKKRLKTGQAMAVTPVPTISSAVALAAAAAVVVRTSHHTMMADAVVQDHSQLGDVGEQTDVNDNPHAAAQKQKRKKRSHLEDAVVQQRGDGSNCPTDKTKKKKKNKKKKGEEEG